MTVQKRTEEPELIEPPKFTQSSYGGSTDTWLDELPTPLYKFLDRNARPTHAPYGSFNWSLPTKNEDGSWTPGEWAEVKLPLYACRNGLHLTDAEHTPHWSGHGYRLFEVETEGGGVKSGFNGDQTIYLSREAKYVASKVRLVREIEGFRNVNQGGYDPLPDIPAEMMAEYRAKVTAMVPRAYRALAADEELLDRAMRDASHQIKVWKAKRMIRRYQMELRRLQGKPTPRLERGTGPSAQLTKAQRKAATLNSLQSAVGTYRFHEIIAMIRTGGKLRLLDQGDYSRFWWTNQFTQEADAAKNELIGELTKPIEFPSDIPQEIVDAFAKAGRPLKPTQPKKRTEV